MTRMDAPLNGVCTDLLSLTNPQPWTDLDPPLLWGDQLFLWVGSLETYIRNLETAVSVFSRCFWLPRVLCGSDKLPWPPDADPPPRGPQVLLNWAEAGAVGRVGAQLLERGGLSRAGLSLGSPPSVHHHRPGPRLGAGQHCEQGTGPRSQRLRAMEKARRSRSCPGEWTWCWGLSVGFCPCPACRGLSTGQRGPPNPQGPQPLPTSARFLSVFQIKWISVSQGLLQNFSGETQTEVDKLNKQGPQKARLKVSIISEVKGTKVNADGSS